MFSRISRCSRLSRRTSIVRPQSYLTSSSTSYSTTSNKVSAKVLEFVKNESIALEMSMNESRGALSQHSFNFPDLDRCGDAVLSLDLQIRLKLFNTIEDNRKLLLLLSYPPNKIDPMLYMYFYVRLRDSAQLDPNQTRVLIRRLTYHKQFHFIWRVVEDSPDYTLSDIEDLIDEIQQELVKYNYQEIGVLELLKSASLYIGSSASLRNTIVDTICFKNKLDKRVMADHYELLVRARASQSIQDIPDFMLAYPGLISFVFPNISVAELESNKRLSGLISLNLFDFDCLLRGNSNEAYKLYHYFKRFTPPDSLSTNDDILNSITASMLRNNSTRNIIDCINTYSKKLPKDICSLLLVHIYISAADDWHLYMTPSMVDKFIHNLLSRLKLVHTTLAFNTHTLELIKRLHEHNYLSKGVLESILKFIDQPEWQNYTEVLKLENLTLNNLMEISDHICRTYHSGKKKEDTLFLCSVYTELFKKLLSLLVQIYPISQYNEIESDFYQLYLDSNKKRFFLSFHSLGRSTALLPDEEIIRIINTISVDIKSQPNLTSSNQKYILDKLIQVILIAIDEQFRNKIGVSRMKNIVLGLNFDSKVSHALLYQYLVKYEPTASINIIESYKDNKAVLTNVIMRGLMSGILSTPLLEKQDKILLFHKFRNIMKELGYKSEYKVFTAIELINLMVEINESNPNRTLDDIIKVLEVAKKMKVPKEIIQNWARRLMILNPSGNGSNKYQQSVEKIF